MPSSNRHCPKCKTAGLEMNQEGYVCPSCGANGDLQALTELAKSFNFSTGEKIAEHSPEHVKSDANSKTDERKPFGHNPLFDRQEARYWFYKAFQNYAEFSGRARRREYWYFFLDNTANSVLLGILDATFQTGGIFAGIYLLCAITPSIAVGVRRLHDTNHSGWWLLFPLLNLYYLVCKGHEGDNRFGPEPEVYSKTNP